MIRKYISHMGVTIEVGDFYGGGVDLEGQSEVVTSLEESSVNDITNLVVHTNMSFHEVTLKAGDYLGMEDGSGKIVKSKHDPHNDNL